MQLEFDKNIAGKKARISDGTTYWVYTLTSDGKLPTVGVSLGNNLIVTLSGWFFIYGTKKYYQTLSSRFVIDEPSNFTLTGQYDVVPVKDSQQLVNTIISNNKRIIENNLLCARFSNKLTTSQTQLLAQLQLRLERRNTALIESGCLTSVSESYPKGYVNFASNLNSVVGKETIGAVLTTIIIVAIVVASLSTAAYFAYQAYAKESIDDVKFSDDLTKTLMSKLTPEEYEQLRQETGGLITKAKLSAKFSGVFGTVKTFGLIGIGAFLVYKLLTRNKQTSNENE